MPLHSSMQIMTPCLSVLGASKWLLPKSNAPCMTVLRALSDRERFTCTHSASSASNWALPCGTCRLRPQRRKCQVIAQTTQPCRTPIAAPDTEALQPAQAGRAANCLLSASSLLTTSTSKWVIFIKPNIWPSACCTCTMSACTCLVRLLPGRRPKSATSGC